jgi:hypothetical protein
MTYFQWQEFKIGQTRPLPIEFQVLLEVALAEITNRLKLMARLGIRHYRRMKGEWHTKISMVGSSTGGDLNFRIKFRLF